MSSVGGIGVDNPLGNQRLKWSDYKYHNDVDVYVDRRPSKGGCSDIPGGVLGQLPMAQNTVCVLFGGNANTLLAYNRGSIVTQYLAAV